MLNRIASNQGYNSSQQPAVLLQPGMASPPPTGYSQAFNVGADPKIIIAAPMNGEGERWSAAVQVSPDGGETYTDLIIHGQAVVLNALQTMVKVPVTGKYRLRTTAVFTTFVAYSMMSTHEPDLPMVNLNVPGPTGATGAGATGHTGPTGATGFPGGPTGGTGVTGPAMMPTPYDYGAVGDGTTDDTVAMQDWLNAIAGGAGYGQAGSFLCTAAIGVSSDTWIMGAGDGQFKIIAATSDIALLGNAHPAYPGGTIAFMIPNNPGANYAIGDTGYASGGFANNGSGTYTVTGVDGGGGITSLSFAAGDNYFTLANQPLVNAGSQPGVGSGATVDIVANPSVRVDKNIRIEGVCFEDGEGVDPGNGDWVDFLGVDGLIIRDCLFQHHHKNLLILGNCINVTVDDNEFFDWGDGSPFAPGHFGGGMGIFCIYPNFNVRIINNYLHQAENGGGIWLSVTNSNIPMPPEGEFFICANNIITFVCEAGIVGAPDASVISGNVISGVILKDLSGHGAEIHGTNFTFTNNVIQLCDHTCAFFANISNVIISDNLFNLPNQLEGGDAALTIAAFSAASNEGDVAPYNVTIVGNQFSSADGKGVIGLQFTNASGDPANLMNQIQVTGNNFGPPATWPSGPILIGSDVMGVDFIHKNNVGTTDCDPFTGDFLIPNTGTGDITITGIPFRPRTVSMDAITPSGGAVSRCTVFFNHDFSSFSNSFAVDGLGTFGTTGTNLAVYKGNTDLLVSGIVSSWTPDGFVFSLFGTSGANVYVNYVAYP